VAKTGDFTQKQTNKQTKKNYSKKDQGMTKVIITSIESM
jgi:hypothetical protein